MNHYDRAAALVRQWTNDFVGQHDITEEALEGLVRKIEDAFSAVATEAYRMAPR